MGEQERGTQGEGRERKRNSPAQLPGEKTALVLTQDSLCLTLLPGSLSLSVTQSQLKFKKKKKNKLAIFSHMHALLVKRADLTHGSCLLH